MHGQKGAFYIHGHYLIEARLVLVEDGCHVALNTRIDQENIHAATALSGGFHHTRIVIGSSNIADKIAHLIAANLSKGVGQCLFMQIDQQHLCPFGSKAFARRQPDTPAPPVMMAILPANRLMYYTYRAKASSKSASKSSISSMPLEMRISDSSMPMLARRSAPISK